MGAERKKERKRDTHTKREVRFVNDKVSIKKMISVHDMTKEEIEETWFSFDELKGIRERCKSIANSYYTMQLHCSDDDDDEEQDDSMYYRGLESITPHTKASKRLNRLDSIMLVLDEVDRQYEGENGSIHDPEKIKSLYQQISVDCQLEAEKRGIQDRKEIEGEEEEDSKEEKWNDGRDGKVLMKQKQSKMLAVAAAAAATTTTTTKTTKTES